MLLDLISEQIICKIFYHNYKIQYLLYDCGDDLRLFIGHPYIPDSPPKEKSSNTGIVHESSTANIG